MSQNMESGEDVSPLDHLSQWTPLQHLGAEDISRLFCEEAHMDQDLEKDSDRDCFVAEGKTKVCGLQKTFFVN